MGVLRTSLNFPNILVDLVLSILSIKKYLILILQQY